MTQTTTPTTPGVPATMNSVWPPSNPSGTVIPFPLPWGATGCCPPGGGLDALMKCYCDIQQASAFIGQIMLDQIANNPAIIQAIIAALEKSGSNLPLIGVTNGSDAQPGQVGEHIQFGVAGLTIPNAQDSAQNVTMGVMQPGDWDCWAYLFTNVPVDGIEYSLLPSTVGFSNPMTAFIGNLSGLGGLGANMTINTPVARLSTAVPTLVVFVLTTWSTTAGNAQLQFEARRVR